MGRKRPAYFPVPSESIQKHGAELPGPDQTDPDGAPLRLTLEEQPMEIHARLLPTRGLSFTLPCVASIP
jgi:hypothetical protein